MLILRRRFHLFPQITPASTQLLIKSLTALLASSMVFVVIGARNNVCSVLGCIAVVGSSFDVACGC